MDIVLVEKFFGVFAICIDIESLSFAFAVICSKNRCMDPIISMRVEIFMDVISQSASDAENSVESIGLHSPLRIISQIFERGFLLLKRIRFIDRADKLDMIGIDFKRLFVFRGELQNASCLNGASKLCLKSHLVSGFVNDLNVFEARAIIDRKEADITEGAVGSDKTADSNCGAIKGGKLCCFCHLVKSLD